MRELTTLASWLASWLARVLAFVLEKYLEVSTSTVVFDCGLGSSPGHTLIQSRQMVHSDPHNI